MTTTGMLEGHVALVTGASAGIGRAAALAFAAQGAAVVLSDVDDSRGALVLKELTALGHDAHYVHCDIAETGAPAALVASALDRFGRLDHAFNNAGIEGEQAPSAECTAANWNRVIATNLSGTWWCMQAELQVMVPAGHGTIVNNASVAGLVGFAGIPAYTASKHGIVGFTKTAALEYATAGVRVNAVCPGVIDTEMIERFTHGEASARDQLLEAEPIGRLGRPEEVADAVVWLSSPQSGFVTGQAVAVDGGFVAR